MATLQFELVAPERVLYSGPVDAVMLPATEGDMTVLPGHAPVMTALKTGFIVITDHKDHGTRVLVQTRGGDRDVRAYLAPHPASHKRFQTVRSPANAPLQTTPFAINTFWAPVDELIG